MSSASATRMPGTHHRAEVNGIRLHYTRAGSGEPVVLLHSFPTISYCRRKIIPALAEQFTVIAPDLRGCGDSDRLTAGYDKRTVAEDIHQFVRSLGLGPVNVVSHDTGMMVAYAYASRYPAEVKRLALMEAALAGFGLEDLYDASKTPRMFHLPLFEALIAGREKLFVSHMMRQQAYNTTGLEKEALDEYARHLSAPSALHGMEIVDADELRVGFSMRRSRDEGDAPHLQFTTFLPKAAPPELVRRHLNHFAIEFRNWTRAALVASQGERP